MLLPGDIIGNGRILKTPGEILEFTGQLASFSSIEDLTNVLIPSVERLLGADGSTLFYVSGSARLGRIYKPVFRNVPEDSSRSYPKYYYKLDPFTAEVRRRVAEGGIPVCASFEVVGPEEAGEFEQSEFYVDFLQGLGIRHLILFCIARDKHPVAYFAVQRWAESRDFTEEDLALARVLAPHVTAAIDRIHLADENQKNTHIIDFLSVDVFNRGLLILNEGYDLEMANTRAIDILTDVPGFVPVLSRVPDAVTDACREFLCEYGRDNTTSRIEFSIPGQEPELRGYVRLKDTGDQNLMFLAFINPEQQIAINPEQLKCFRLTRRETEIARSVADGMTNPQIADDLFVSVRTVQNHLRSIYGKVGVRNRTSLIKQLMTVE